MSYSVSYIMISTHSMFNGPPE